jgi:poly-gamma-glutamate capsule biosynthesis protein CapA/YwtB (metallophosphatase superfamily)
MSWLRRMLGRWAPEDLPPAVASVDHVDLARAKVEQRRILTRADEAIHEAMAHADQAFGSPHWVERRRKPR